MGGLGRLEALWRIPRPGQSLGEFERAFGGVQSLERDLLIGVTKPRPVAAVTEGAEAIPDTGEVGDDPVGDDDLDDHRTGQYRIQPARDFTR
jgi:hypothetical protein